MKEQYREFLKFIKILSDNDCLEHVVLIGSWAEYMYSVSGLLGDYVANIRTLDVDFLIKNMRKPTTPINIGVLAREEGCYVDQDCLTGVTKILNPNGLEVEFLISKVGRGAEASLKTNLGVTAQSLRHLDVLKKNIITINHMGMKIEVPKPEAFVIHKMIINSDRKDKIEKDQRVINSMYFYLDENTFNEIILQLNKKEKQKVNEYINEFIKPEIDKQQAIRKAKEKLFGRK